MNACNVLKSGIARRKKIGGSQHVVGSHEGSKRLYIDNNDENEDDYVHGDDDVDEDEDEVTDGDREGRAMGLTFG